MKSPEKKMEITKMDEEQQTKKTETLTLSPKIEWNKGEEAFRRIHNVLSDEIAYLTADLEIRNAYSPIAWARLCMDIKHLTQGMAAIRLHCEGKNNKEIAAATGLSGNRIAAFKAWNTIYKKSIHRVLTLRGRNKQQRDADLEFLKSIGVSILDGGAK
jgi:hypothetical protein